MNSFCEAAANKALGLDRVHLMGHALGGWIAAELATRSTARLASLTLAAPFGIFEPDAAVRDLPRLLGEVRPLGRVVQINPLRVGEHEFDFAHEIARTGQLAGADCLRSR